MSQIFGMGKSLMTPGGYVVQKGRFSMATHLIGATHVHLTSVQIVNEIKSVSKIQIKTKTWYVDWHLIFFDYLGM